MCPASSSRVDRGEEEARQRLREEVRALRWHALTSTSDGKHVLHPRRPEKECDIGVAIVDERHRVDRARRVAYPVESVSVDELDVELPFRSPNELDAAPAICNCTRARERLAGEERERLAEIRAQLTVSRVQKVWPAREHAVRRKDVQPGVVDGDDQRHDSRTGRAQLRAKL